MMKSLSLNNLVNDDRHQDNENDQILSKLNIDQDQKTTLIERKKQKWANEMSMCAFRSYLVAFNYLLLKLGDVDNAWNPFGRPGAGAPRAAALQVEQPIKKTASYMHKEELSKKQLEMLAGRPSSIHDQAHVPAAMRTSLLFGDVLFDDDVKRTKELERKKWLNELEAQKREKLMEKEFNKEKDKLTDFKKDIEDKRQYVNDVSVLLKMS